MSSLKEKLEKKKNKYLQRLTNKDKSKKSEDADGSDSDSTEALPETQLAGSAAADTPQKTPKIAPSLATNTPVKGQDATEGKEKKEVWKYEGEYNAEGEYHGVGRLYSTTTIEFYEGQWMNGKRHGFGTQLFVTGERYQGAWKGGLMDGMGVISYPTKDSYTGQWELGQRVNGTWNFTNGDVNVIYTEKWVNGAPGPYGELVFNPGGKYVGEVSNSVAGKYTIKNYVVFRHGYGEMLYSNKKGDRYIGGWKKDSRKGYGVFIEASGEKYYGEWTRGKRSGYGVQIYTDGTYYEGQHLHDEMKGKGKICVPNGDTVLGEWANNKLTNATFLKGNFDLVARPMREVFVANVQSVRKAEEKAPFISTEKWQAFTAKLEIDPANFTFDMIESTLLQIQMENDNEVKEYAYVIPGNSISKSVNRFIYMFNWLYGDQGGEGFKNSTYNLQTAVDDVNSFLAAMTLRIATALNLEYQSNKRLFALLMQTVFGKIYNTLFPLYVEQLRVKDAILSAKLMELKDTTTISIGVKPKYQCIRDPSKAPRPDAVVAPATVENLSIPRAVSSPALPSMARESPRQGQSPFQTSPQGEGSSGTLTRGSSRRPTKISTLNSSSEDKEKEKDPLSPKISALPSDTDSAESPDREKEATDFDPLTGLPKEQRPSKGTAKPSRFNTLTAPRRTSSSNEKKANRHRQSVNVSDLLSKNESGLDKDFDDLAALVAAEEVERSRLTILEDGAETPSPPVEPKSPKLETKAEPKPEGLRSRTISLSTSAQGSPRARITVDPNDIEAQLALEDASRRKKPDAADLAQAEADMMRRMGMLPNRPSPSRDSSRDLLVKAATAAAASTEGVVTPESDSGSNSNSNSLASRGSTDAKALTTPKYKSAAVITVDPNDPRKDLPYYPVILALDRLQVAVSPNDKLDCLASAGQGILKCVDEWNTNKSEQIVMGAEDKFPILIYALIRSTAKNLRCHAQFLADFVTEHVGDMDSKYRVSELNDALKYIESLQWNVRDKQGYLVPVKLILSHIGWAVKGLQRLKIPEGCTLSKSQAIADITVCISQLFRHLGDRVTSPYEPFEVPSQYNALIRPFKTSVFEPALGKEVGLVLKEKGDSFVIEFEIKHPLYVYAQLAQIAIAPESADLS